MSTVRGRIAARWPGLVALSRSRCALRLAAGESMAPDPVRRLCPAALIVPAALALLLLSGAFGPLGLSAAIAVPCLAVVVVVVVGSALAVARCESRRRDAERTVAERDAQVAVERARLNDEIEERVAERIAE